MKRFKYLLLLFFILVLSPNAYSYTYDVTNKITAPSGSGSTGGHYLGLEIYNSGSQNNYSVNTRYNGTLSSIVYNLLLPSDAGSCFTTNMEYTITMEMATSDWRNHFARPFVGAYHNATNWVTSSVTFVSQKKIYFKFKIPSSDSNCYSFVYVTLDSPNVSSTAFTGVTNWNLSKISLTDQYSNSGGSSPTPTSSPNSNQDIINNQNNNTTEIIDNQNNNTSNIIDNNNQNTQSIIDNQNQNQEQTNQLLGSCNKNYFDLSSSFLSSTANYTISNSTGTLNVTNSSWKNVRFAIPVSTGNYNFSFNNSLANNVNVVLYYNSSADYNNSTWLANMTSTNKNITISNAGYLIVNIYDSSNSAINYSISGLKLTNTYTSNFILPNQSVCTSKLDETNNFLTDSSDPSISDNEFLNTFNSIGVSDPLSYLLTLPVQLINKMVSLSGSCSPINLGSLYGTMLTLPCINLENILGSVVWNIIDVIFSVSLLVVILKNLYDTFSNLLTMGAEKEAKEKFSMPTPMDFLSMILGGDR